MLLQILLIFIATLGTLYYWWMNQYSYWKKRGVPYIEPTFPYGTLRNKEKPMHHAFLHQKNYNKMKGKGPFCGTYTFFKPSLLVTDLNFAKRVLVKDFEHFHCRGMYHNEKDDPLSVSLASLEDQKWKNLRAKLTPTFTSAKMKYMFGTMIEIGHKLVEVLGKENPKKVEIREIMSKYTTDMIGSCAFGLECNSLEDPNALFRKWGKEALGKPRQSRFVRIFMMAIGKFI